MKSQLKSIAGAPLRVKPVIKDIPHPDLKTRKTELDYMCTYMTWLMVKERYTRELQVEAG